jgi:hypothetical protein
MKLASPVCACSVVGEDVDLPHGRALCRPCAELFPLPPAPLVPVQPGPFRNGEYRGQAAWSMTGMNRQGTSFSWQHRLPTDR